MLPVPVHITNETFTKLKDPANTVQLIAQQSVIEPLRNARRKDPQREFTVLTAS